MSKKKTVNIFIGNIIHCTKAFQFHLLENGFIIVEDNKILAQGGQSQLEETKSRLTLEDKNIKSIILEKFQILIPGLIDTHIHAVQFPNIGIGYDVILLEWLEKYTYDLEKRYKNPDFSKSVFNDVVKQTLSNGTTTACYFASLYEDCSLILADTAIKLGQRALIGKINMTTCAPKDYVETPEESLTKTKSFIKLMKEKKSELVIPIITPRFALSVDMDFMQKLGVLAKEENLRIQSHISENKEEVALVEEKYNDNYASVYDKAGLLTPKTIMAHGIHLKDLELKLLANRGTSISHCPDSNTCLKSGLCDVKKLIQHGIKVGLGTDVSGGPTPSIIKTMKAALDTSIHLSFINAEYVPLNYQEIFYLATLGGAEALALDDKIGNFEVGKEFDALIVDMHLDNKENGYQLDWTPLEILQKFIYLGDDRNVVNVFVAGNLVK